MNDITMSVWGMVGQKGGSGKTMLGLQLANYALKLERKPVLLDLDRQRSAVEWYHSRTALIGDDTMSAAQGGPPDLAEMLERAKHMNCALAIIDTPPTIDEAIIATARYSDLLILPTRAEMVDRRSLSRTLSTIGNLGVLRKTVVVLNQIHKSKDGSAKQEEEDTRQLVRDAGASVLKTKLDFNRDYSVSLDTGKGVPGFRTNRKSYQNLRALYDELVAFETSLKPS